jgi:ATP-dependent DNA helicase RecG
MQRFAKGETQIMVATTVIEVGVNVPNATVMVIESAERFGLSQLHQLRGRVGRGGEQSFCILMTGHKLSNEARTRMRTMVETNDGFKIAEVDLKLRGPGDMSGTQQSGVLSFRLADLSQDQAILQAARETAIELLSADALMERPEHAALRYHLSLQRKSSTDWSKIS